MGGYKSDARRRKPKVVGALNLMVGLNGYTLCSGIICEELNGNDYAAVPLAESEKMRIGYIRHKGIKVSPIGELYVDILKKSGKPL